MAATLPLSVYIRTMNEAARLGPVLQAARAISEDVVIVDSGSTDATRAIAEAAGARVIDQPWLGNGPQKRVGEAACRHDWVLDIDSDEEVSDALAAEIRALFASGPPPHPVYILDVTLCPPVGGPWSGFGYAKRPKLYDRRVAQIPDDFIWDQARWPKDATTGRLRGPLIHRSFSDADDFMAKMNRISTRNARHQKMKSRRYLALRVLFGLPVYMAKNLFGRGMIRGGVYGVATAGMISIGRWLRDVKMYEIAHGLGARADGADE